MLRSIALITLSLMPLAAASAASAAPAPIVAEKDGLKFEYTTAVQDGGRVVIDGRLVDEREKFHLVVEPTGFVHGKVGFSPVSFSVSRKARDTLLSEVGGSPTLAVAQAGLNAN